MKIYQFPPSDQKFIKQKRALNTTYKRRRAKYLAAHPICEICKNFPSIVIHHLKSRKTHKNDISVFQAACIACEKKQHNR